MNKYKCIHATDTHTPAVAVQPSDTGTSPIILHPFEFSPLAVCKYLLADITTLFTMFVIMPSRISSHRILSAKPIPCGLLFLIHATFNPLVSLSVFVYPFIPSFPECHISLPQNSIAFNLKWVGVPTRPWSVCLPWIVVAVQHPAFNILLHLRLAFCGFVQFPISRFFYICGDVVHPPPPQPLLWSVAKKTHKKLHFFRTFM